MKPALSPVLRSPGRTDPPRLTHAQLLRDIRKLLNTRACLLIAIRKHLGLTHEEVAARAGISPSTVRTHEAASERARHIDYYRICESGLGFRIVAVDLEVSRRVREAGCIGSANRKPERGDQFLKEMMREMASEQPAAYEELQRQLRVLKKLTLPSRPGPPARKRKAKQPVANRR